MDDKSVFLLVAAALGLLVWTRRRDAIANEQDTFGLVFPVAQGAESNVTAQGTVPTPTQLPPGSLVYDPGTGRIYT